MNLKSLFSVFLSLTLTLSTVINPSAMAGTSASSTVVSSGSGGNSTAQAVITGQNAVVTINGDRIEVKDGKLTLNGIPYGTVGQQSIVKYTVNGKVKKLLVDGVERRPEL